MSATHNDRVSITVFLAAQALSAQGFGTVLILADEANGSTLGGDRVRTYQTYAAALADTANLGADALAAAQVAFSQTERPPSAVKIGRVDTAGPETWLQGYQACVVADPDFFGVTMINRTLADVVAVSAEVETQDRLFFFQSSDAGWLTSGVPAAVSGIVSNENTTGIFHDEDTEYAEIGWACARLAWNPDSRSVPWSSAVDAVAAYTTGLTDTQKGFARANEINLILPFGSIDQWVDPGENLAGRPVYELVTKYWLKARIGERLANLKVQYSAAGRKLTVDAAGQAAILAELNAVVAQGQSGDSPHFTASVSVVAEAITGTDQTNRELRFTIQAQIAQDALSLSADAYLTTTEIVVVTE